MDSRRWTVRGLTVLVFLALPYALKHLGLIQNLGDNKVFCRFCPDPGELILMWNSPDRLYEIKGLLSQDRAIEIANSIN